MSDETRSRISLFKNDLNAEMMLIMAILAAAGSRNYAGSVLGVSVRVSLDELGQRAHVRLQGAPFFGRLEGEAFFDDDRLLVLDETLSEGLSRRACSVSEVNENKIENVIEVIVKLPIFGKRVITLQRESA